MLNHTFADGTIVELGGQWIGPSQLRVRALAEELGIGLFASYDDGAGILALGGRQVRFTDATFGLTGDVLEDVGTVQAEMEELAATVVLGAPWQTPDAAALDRITADTWLVEHCQTTDGPAVLAGADHRHHQRRGVGDLAAALADVREVGRLHRHARVDGRRRAGQPRPRRHPAARDRAGRAARRRAPELRR